MEIERVCFQGNKCMALALPQTFLVRKCHNQDPGRKKCQEVAVACEKPFPDIVWGRVFLTNWESVPQIVVWVRAESGVVLACRFWCLGLCHPSSVGSCSCRCLLMFGCVRRGIGRNKKWFEIHSNGLTKWKESKC